MTSQPEPELEPEPEPVAPEPVAPDLVRPGSTAATSATLHDLAHPLVDVGA